MDISHPDNEDRDAVIEMHRQAFGAHVSVALLTEALLDDPTAQPMISLLAKDGGRAIGHILLTHVELEGDDSKVQAMILAPLAVVPYSQKKGVGTALMRAALAEAKDAGVELVFVLGHPTYYPRVGFQPAGRLGFEAPYPIEEKDADAWMVLETRPGFIGSVKGKLKVAVALDQPEHWVE